MEPIYWYVGGGFTTLTSLIAIVYGITSKNTNRLNEHDVLFAKLESIPDAIDTLTGKVDGLVVDVAVIKNNFEKK